MEDYKQKYEEAIARMNKWVEGSEIIDPKEVAEFVFPELKKSEDERIREEIIYYLDREITLSNFGGATFRKWIAWLEKQREQKPTDKVEPKWKKGNDGEFLYETSIVWLHNETKTLATAGLLLDSNTFYIPISELEKLPKEEAEEKPTDKIESKFKVGDWVRAISSGNIFKILSVNDELYRVLCYDGVEANYPIEVEKDLTYWTIQDAKDGDVLYHKNPLSGIEYIVMSRGVNGYGNVDSYFRYNSEDGFDKYIPSVFNATSDNITPATKEQRDFLFQKMKEAGYEWDAEKKELKKIEQKPIEIPFGTDSELVEETIIIPNGCYAVIEDNKVILRKGEQKPAWSEEDEE